MCGCEQLVPPHSLPIRLGHGRQLLFAAPPPDLGRRPSFRCDVGTTRRAGRGPDAMEPASSRASRSPLPDAGRDLPKELGHAAGPGTPGSLDGRALVVAESQSSDRWRACYDSAAGGPLPSATCVLLADADLPSASVFLMSAKSSARAARCRSGRYRRSTRSVIAPFLARCWRAARCPFSAGCRPTGPGGLRRQQRY